MSQSIENLYPSCQDNLDHDRKEIQYHLEMETRELISRWVKSSRDDAGLTQTELGEKLGVTKANVSSWEKLRHEPSVTQVLKIAETCKCQLPNELSAESMLSKEALRFALSYQALPQKFRLQLLDSLTTAEIAARNLDDQDK